MSSPVTPQSYPNKNHIIDNWFCTFLNHIPAGSRGRQISHATNVKIENLVKVLKYLNYNTIVFYHAAVTYDCPVSTSCSVSNWYSIQCSPVIKFDTVAEPTSLVKSMSSWHT